MVPQMNENDIMGLFANTLNPEPTIRKKAETELSTMKKHIWFPKTLLCILQRPEDAEPGMRAIKQSASVYLKNLIQKSYRDDIDNDNQEFVIHEDDKKFLRSNIMETVAKVPEQIQSQLAVCINRMIKADYDTGKWNEELNTKILDFIQNENSDPHHWLAALITLLQLTKVFEFKKEEERESLLNAMQTFLPVMLKVSEELIQTNSSEYQLLQKYILKIFFALSQYNLPVGLLRNQIDKWMLVLNSVLEAEVPKEIDDLETEEKLEAPHWKAKKWALHIITRLFERYGAPGNVEDEYEEFAKFFLRECAVPLLKTQMGILEKHRSGVWVSPRVLQLILSYMTHSVNHAITWEQLKGDTYKSLLTEVLFPLMCFSEEDNELWEDDPEEYIRLKFDVFEEMTSPKSAAEDFVNVATAKRKGPLSITMDFAQQFLLQSGQIPAEKYDGAFNLICCVAQQLMKKKPYKNRIDDLTNQFFVALCSRPEGYLRARGLHCIKQFSEAQLKKQTLNKVFTKSLEILMKPDEELPVSVEAAMALSKLASEHQEKATSFMKQHIGDVLKQCLQLVNRTVNDDLTDVVKQFIQDFQEEVEPFAVDLAEGIKSSFIAMAENNDESNDDYDNKALTAVGILTTLETLLEIMEDSEDLVASLEDVVRDVIVWVFNNKKMDYYEEAMSLLSSITTHKINPNIWPALQGLQEILEAGKDGGVEFFVDMMPAVHNFVTVDSQTFFGNQENIQRVFSMIMMTLESSDSGEDAELHALKLLEVCIFQAGAVVPGIVFEAVKLAYNRGFGALSLARPINTSELRVMCTNVIIASLLVDQDPEQTTLNFLQSQNWVDQGLRQWLDDFDCTFGIHDRRLALLAMAKFLTADQFPAVINESIQEILPKCLILFKGLEKAYEWRAAEEADTEDEDDEDEEGMDEPDDDEINGREIENALDDDEDDLDDGKQYLEMLKKFQMDDGPEEGETALEDYTTVIDEDGIPYEGSKKDKEGIVIQHDIPNEYDIFMTALDHLKASNDHVFQVMMGSLDGDQTQFLDHCRGEAKKRAAADRSKQIEKEGGYKFDPNMKASFDFTGGKQQF